MGGACAADLVAHLQERLMLGELPQKNHPKAVLVLIGTNDLGVPMEAGEPAVLAAVPNLILRCAQPRMKYITNQHALASGLQRELRRRSGPAQQPGCSAAAPASCWGCCDRQ